MGAFLGPRLCLSKARCPIWDSTLLVALASSTDMLPGSREEDVLKRLDLRVKEIMRSNPPTIPAEATILQAARAMAKQDSAYVFVKSKRGIVGVLTERDIIRRVVEKGTSPGKIKVESVMTSPMVVVSPEAKVEEALNVMITNKVRMLPIMDEKAGLVGLVSVSDIAKALAEKSGYTSSLIAAMTKESPPPSGVYG